MNKQSSSLTLDDIARLAGVSKSTVSRALNDSPLLNSETKDRIQAIAHAHNFRLNISARNLRLRESRTIAFVAPNYYPNFLSAEDLFGMEILGGIGNGLHTLGYDLLIVHADPADDTWARSYLESGRVDGFILLASNTFAETIKTLDGLKAAFIVWGTPLAGYDYCSVSGDNVFGGLQATRHLLRTGHKRIAFLGGPESERTVQDRLTGYKQVLQAAGRELDPALIAFGDYSFLSGDTAMQRLLKQAPDLDAVFVNSDLMAINAIHTLQTAGRRVPEDVAVVGYDDLPIAAFNNLPLTTVRQNINQAGKLLAMNLIEHIRTGAITHVTTAVELVVRRSA